MITESHLTCRACMSTTVLSNGDKWVCQCCGDPIAEVSHSFDAVPPQRFPVGTIAFITITLLIWAFAAFAETL